MGCDIHAHVEIRVDGEWLYYSPTNIRRNYAAFAKMANVRNALGEVTPISEPRGLPEDISPMARLHRARSGVDGHSDSWLTHDECVGLIDWLEDEISQGGVDLLWKYTFLGRDVYLFGNTVYSWQRFPEDYPDYIQDVRLVFWFDS